MRSLVLGLVLCLSPFCSLFVYAGTDLDRTPCSTCNSAEEFWVYGAGYIFEHHNGALAALGNNDRIVVINPQSGVEFTIDVDNIDAAVCFFYCISYPPRGRWEVHYQRHGDSEQHSRKTFLNVLVENYRKIKERERVFELAAREVADDMAREAGHVSRGYYVGVTPYYNYQCSYLCSGEYYY